MVVLAGRVHDQIGFEFLQNRQDRVFEHIEKPFFGTPGRQRQIDRRSGRVRAAKLHWKSGTGIQGAPVLVHGYEKRVGVVPVDVLSAVSVMAVGIHYRHAVNSVRLAQVFDHHGFDVDIAEASSPVHHPHGMMAGRTNQGETALDIFFEHLDADRFRAPGAYQVRFGDYAQLIRNAEVDPLNVFYRGNVGLEFHDPFDIENTLLEYLVLCVEKAFLTFRMRRADRPIESGEEYEAGSGRSMRAFS